MTGLVYASYAENDFKIYLSIINKIEYSCAAGLGLEKVLQGMNKNLPIEIKQGVFITPDYIEKERSKFIKVAEFLQQEIDQLLEISKKDLESLKFRYPDIKIEGHKAIISEYNITIPSRKYSPNFRNINDNELIIFDNFMKGISFKRIGLKYNDFKKE